jgi:hypothetical protein
VHAHTLYRDVLPKSIKQAIDAANNDDLEYYLPLTDSIIGMIKCHEANGAKESLKKVGLRYLYIILYTHKVVRTLNLDGIKSPCRHVCMQSMSMMEF